MEEFQYEIGRLKEENNELRYQKEIKERDFENLMFESNTLSYKLENLENIFVGAPIQRNNQINGGEDIENTNGVPSEDYNASQVS